MYRVCGWFRVHCSGPQETALPLSRHFGVTAEIDDRFREVPLDENRAIRKAWLVDVASMCWHEVDDAVTA